MCLGVGGNLEKIHKGQDLFSSRRDCQGRSWLQVGISPGKCIHFITKMQFLLP